MKTRLALVTCALVMTQALANAAEPPPATSASLYQQGIAAVDAGDPLAARTFFTQALKADPNNANARFQLMEVQKNASSIASKGREIKFGKVPIEKLLLDGASLREALDVISKQVSIGSKEEISPNFIIQDEKGLFASKQITLRLNGVPAKAALEYVLSQAGGKARFDEHAIVITPRGGS